MRLLLAGLFLALSMLGGNSAFAFDWSSLSSLATRAQSPDPAVTTAPRILSYSADGTLGAPFVLKDPAVASRTIGVNVDVMAQLAARLGRMPIFVQNTRDTVASGLGAELYEVAFSASATAAAAMGNANVSIPYYTSFGQIVIRRGDPAIKTVAELEGKRVGAIHAGPIAEMLTHVPGIRLATYASAAAVYADLKQGGIDAAVLDFPIAVYLARPDRALQFTGEPVGRIQYGLAVRPGASPELLGAINTGIYSMMQDGSLRRILDRWALWTPMMAQEAGDARSAQMEPAAYEYFIEATRPRTFTTEVERYARFLPLLARAVLMTCQVSLLAMGLAVTLGALLALASGLGGAVLRHGVRVYVNGVRGIPVLIIILVSYYGLPKLGLRLDPLAAGVLALGLHYAAHAADTFRIGLLAIPRDQMDAAIALNMTRFQALRNVILPQAARMVLPRTSRDFVALMKDSSLLSVIPLLELTRAYQEISTTYSDYFGPGLLVAAIYLLIGLPLRRLAQWAEAYAGRGMVATAL